MKRRIKISLSSKMKLTFFSPSVALMWFILCPCNVKCENLFKLSNSSAKYGCRSGWLYSPFSKSCLFGFFDPNEAKDYKEAYSRCITAGSEHGLVRVISPEYNKWLLDTFRPYNISFWIGLDAVDEPLVWRWQKEIIPSKSNFYWAHGEPSSGKKCAQILSQNRDTDSNNTFGTEKCDSTAPYVCEMLGNCGPFAQPSKYLSCGFKCSPFCKKHPIYSKLAVCDKRTRGCYLGCSKIGKQPPDCLTNCRRGYYGDQCATSCPPGCRRPADSIAKICNHITGRCLHGCNPGYLGENCDRYCPQGKFGQNCSYECPQNCGSGKCDHVSGYCEDCILGFSGALCTIPCEPGTWGQNCANDCFERCAGIPKLCDILNGSCTLGCERGWAGERCTINSQAKVTYTEQVMVQLCLYGLFSALSTIVACLIIADEQREIATERKKTRKRLGLPEHDPDSEVDEENAKTTETTFFKRFI